MEYMKSYIDEYTVKSKVHVAIGLLLSNDAVLWKMKTMRFLLPIVLHCTFNKNLQIGMLIVITIDSIMSQNYSMGL